MEERVHKEWTTMEEGRRSQRDLSSGAEVTFAVTGLLFDFPRYRMSIGTEIDTLLARTLVNACTVEQL